MIFFKNPQTVSYLLDADGVLPWVFWKTWCPVWPPHEVWRMFTCQAKKPHMKAAPTRRRCFTQAKYRVRASKTKRREVHKARRTVVKRDYFSAFSSVDHIENSRRQWIFGFFFKEPELECSWVAFLPHPVFCIGPQKSRWETPHEHDAKEWTIESKLRWAIYT